MNTKLDCIVIGYNEVPFSRYEQFLHAYGEDSEAYRDLKFSFVNLDGNKLDYPGLLNHVRSLAGVNGEELKSGDIPNLAAAYLTNFLRRNGHTAEYINLFQYEKDKLIEYLRRDPLCVAITTTFYVVNLPVTEMVEFIREHNPKVKIVVGGPLVNNHARNYHGDALKTALEDMGADIYVLEGQGELTLARLIECRKNGGNLNDVPNLAYFENKKLHHTTTARIHVRYLRVSPFAGTSGGRHASQYAGRRPSATAAKCSFVSNTPLAARNWRSSSVGRTSTR